MRPMLQPDCFIGFGTHVPGVVTKRTLNTDAMYSTSSSYDTNPSKSMSYKAKAKSTFWPKVTEHSSRLIEVQVKMICYKRLQC